MSEENPATQAAKAALRATMRACRQALTPSEREAASQAICERLVQKWREHQGAVAIFLAGPHEPNLDVFIQTLLDEGAIVAAPRGDEMHRLRDLSRVRRGIFGTREPAHEEPVTPDDLHLVLVPGLAFDACGGRLGQGGGWYDRFLPRVPQAFVIGVCFECQRVECVPREGHDVTVNEVVTEDVKQRGCS